MNNRKSSASFRDPSGFIFLKGKTVYRQINKVYRDTYDFLIESGLYKKLIDRNLLIFHKEVEDIQSEAPDICYKIIKPDKIPFISYPYEWCFSQLRNAALLTLEVQKTALDYGMILKDCSAYNVQFIGMKPIFIDTLSFEKYREGEPWVAYRQFCQHFLAPLAIMKYKDVRLNQLFRVHIDGIPLDLASRLLPPSTFFKFSALAHIHLHAKSQKYYSDKKVNLSSRKMTFHALQALVDNLETFIKGLKWEPRKSEWADYYEKNNYSETAFEHKKKIVAGIYPV